MPPDLVERNRSGCCHTVVISHQRRRATHGHTLLSNRKCCWRPVTSGDSLVSWYLMRACELFSPSTLKEGWAGMGAAINYSDHKQPGLDHYVMRRIHKQAHTHTHNPNTSSLVEYLHLLSERLHKKTIVDTKMYPVSELVCVAVCFEDLNSSKSPDLYKSLCTRSTSGTRVNKAHSITPSKDPKWYLEDLQVVTVYNPPPPFYLSL